jgi:Protein of unknown function (DUF4229)
VKPLLAYTGLRLLVFAVALVLLWLVGARGLLLVALAVLISGVASYVLLSRQRDALSSTMVTRWRRSEDEPPPDDTATPPR